MNLPLQSWLKVAQSLSFARNRWLLAALSFYLLMLVLATVKVFERGLIGSFNDKLLHLLAYALISALIYRGLQFEFLIERLLAAIGLVGVLGAFDELLQLTSSHRVSEFDDWLYDMAGAVLFLLGVIALHLVKTIYRTYTNPDSDKLGRD
jgi:VanZ family protein